MSCATKAIMLSKCPKHRYTDIKYHNYYGKMSCYYCDMEERWTLSGTPYNWCTLHEIPCSKTCGTFLCAECLIKEQYLAEHPPILPP